MPDEYKRVMIDVQTKTETAKKDLDEVDKKANRAHISTTELRRNMALLRRDADLVMHFLESQGIKVDENTKKLIKLFDLGTMIISDGARVITMMRNIGHAANSALGIIGLLIEAITFVNQLYEGLPWAQKISGQIYQATGIPGIRPGLLASWLHDQVTGGRTSTVTRGTSGGAQQQERPGKETA